ncbi:MAG: hypothetical protein K0T01_557 [Acidimicrobiia bacterium]|jgi:hypothetical protein|nr:hypothetical protein [Acidimicrobiia bacterium]
MPVYPACEFPLLSDSQAIDRVQNAVADGEPFSLIRLGDGEAVLLSFGEDMWLQDLAYLHSHWGAERVRLRDVGQVKQDLEKAVQGADVVGIRDDLVNTTLPPDLLQRSATEVRDTVISATRIRQEEVENLKAIGARRLALLHQVLRTIEWSENQQFCSAWIHWELLATGALNRILDEVNEVGLVTSRPELGELVARRFNVRTSTVIVPDKHVVVPGPGEHVPDRFRNIRSELDFPAGTLVLVGAGIPGKVYCQWLKESGCVALDVGSIFDAWVGRASRPMVLKSRFNITEGDRVPSDLQIHVPTSYGGRRLIPRWKPSNLAD